MKTEEKLQRLLEMQEHPERYTEEQIRQLMADDECRQLYEQMVRGTDAVFAAASPQAHSQLSVASLQALPTPVGAGLGAGSVILKLAAAFIGLIMLSGITYAAVHIVTTRTAEKEIVANRKPDLSKAKNVKIIGYNLPIAPSKASPIVFEERELQEIMQYIAEAYSVKFTFKDKAKARLRFYLQWEADDTLQDIIDKINHFEKVHLTLTDETIIIE